MVEIKTIALTIPLAILAILLSVSDRSTSIPEALLNF